jgi:wyosine [tRNA(Phe)-imidazoG37] synthetase (radical SAM superfamily)
MENKRFNYIYGPVSSWRLGSSLGVDLISAGKKICPLDCCYCQLGETKEFSRQRKIFVPTQKVIEELQQMPSVSIDYITFSGTGEPTLALNLGETILKIRKISDAKIAVITNSALINESSVQKDLSLADFVVFKLDAASDDVLRIVDRPLTGIKINDIITGIKTFHRQYDTKIALQIMFFEQNRHQARQLAQIARQIAPNQVQINTPLRPCGVKPLSSAEIDKVKQHFKGLPVISVYQADRKKVNPLSSQDTITRRGKKD